MPMIQKAGSLVAVVLAVLCGVVPISNSVAAIPENQVRDFIVEDGLHVEFLTEKSASASAREHAIVQGFASEKRVRKFIKGQSAVSAVNLLKADRTVARVNARIVSAYECRRGQCQSLRGVYSGRSPYSAIKK